MISLVTSLYHKNIELSTPFNNYDRKKNIKVNSFDFKKRRHHQIRSVACCHTWIWIFVMGELVLRCSLGNPGIRLVWRMGLIPRDMDCGEPWRATTNLYFSVPTWCTARSTVGYPSSSPPVSSMHSSSPGHFYFPADYCDTFIGKITFEQTRGF